MNDTVVFIPARGGSKRIYKKNICDLNNFPLISYTITLSLTLNIPVYVSTDDPEIAAIAKSWGADIIIRPKRLAVDTSLDIYWIMHAIYYLSIQPKKILLLRPTTPLRELSTVKKAIELFTRYYSSLRSVEPITEAIEKTLRVRKGIVYPVFDEKSSLDPNQSFEPSYKANGYIDILRSDCIIKNNSVYGKKCLGFITPRTIEIDIPEDLEYAKYLLEKQVHTRNIS